MRTIWQSLAWKEWHEHKWKLAAFSVIVLAVTCVPLMDYDRETMTGVPMIVMLCVGPLSLFIGAGAATGERSRGTLAFTQSLPVPMWKVSIQKIIFGLLTSIVPAIVTIGILSCLYLVCDMLDVKPELRLRHPFAPYGNEIGLPEWLVISIQVAAVMATSVFLWTAAFGVNRKDEISACAIALLAIVGWWTALFMLPMIFHFGARRSGDPLLPMLFAASPGGYALYALNPKDDLSPWLTLTVALVVQAGYALAFVQRFGKSAKREAASPRAVLVGNGQVSWLAPPKSSQFSALFWKQCRESGPIVLTGLAGIVGTVVLIYLNEPGEFDARTTARMLAVVTAYFGVVVTLIVGIGVYLQDLSPNLNTFWRSRPISPDGWFWTKMLTGMAVLIVTFYIPLIIEVAIADFTLRELNDSSVFLILVPLWIFTAAVLMTCLVRHAVYAGILSIATMYLGFLIVVGTLRITKLGFGQLTWEEMTDPTSYEVAAAMIVSTVVFTILAWLAVRNDWGRKSRY